MSWYLMPSGWPTFAVDGEIRARNLLDQGATIIAETDVQAAIDAYNAGVGAPNQVDLGTAVGDLFTVDGRVAVAKLPDVAALDPEVAAAVAGLASTAYVDGQVAPLADQATVDALALAKLDKTALNPGIDARLGLTGTTLADRYAATASGKLKRSAASIAGFEGLARALAQTTRSVAVQVLGDSTGNDTTDWPYLLAQAIATNHPGWTVQHRLWDDTTQGYAAPATIQTGAAGARYQDCSTGNTSRQMPATVSPYLSGVIDVRMKLSVADWTPAALKSFVGKSGGDPNRGWYAGIQAATGRPFFTFSTGGLGADLQTRVVTVAPTVVDGAVTWLRWVFTPNNGAGGHDFAAYQSADGITWTQLGVTVTTAGTVTIFNNSTIGYSCGSSSGDSIGDPTAKIYEIDIRDGLAGTPVAPRLPDLWPPRPNGTASGFAGAPVLTFVNGSMPGQGVTYLGDATRLPKLTPNFGQAVTFLSTSHNEGSTSGAAWIATYDTWRQAVENRLPGAPTVVLTQNPEQAGATWNVEHAKRRLDLIADARQKRIDVIDTWQAFLDAGWPGTLMLDDVHPNATGSALWRDTVKAHLDASV